MTDKPTPTDAAPPEPLSKRPSEANTLVWVADPISSTGVRGVFVDDITCLWWWGAGLIFQKEVDAAALALRMRSAIASHGQAPAGAAEEIDKALNVYAQAFAARVNGWTRQNGDDLPGARSALFAAIHAYAQASTRPTTSPQADSVQEDAARYRFLRDGEWRGTDLEPFIRLQLNTLWDAKIDAARKQGENHDR